MAVEEVKFVHLRLLVDRSNSLSSRGVVTRSKKTRVSESSVKSGEDESGISGSSVCLSMQENQHDSVKLKTPEPSKDPEDIRRLPVTEVVYSIRTRSRSFAGSTLNRLSRPDASEFEDYSGQNDENNELHVLREEIHLIATPSNSGREPREGLGTGRSSGNEFATGCACPNEGTDVRGMASGEGTPAKQVSEMSRRELSVPDHVKSGIVEIQNLNHRNAQRGGKFYERRKNQEHELIPKSCLQLMSMRESDTVSKRPEFLEWRSWNPEVTYPHSTRKRRGGVSELLGVKSSKRGSFICEEFCMEGRAYFAEIDAFELQEEEEEESEE